MKGFVRMFEGGRVTALAAVSAVLFVAVWFVAWATPDWNPRYVSYKGRHITIEVKCRVHTGIDSLYYKSMLKNLDDFADSLKRDGKLSRGRVSFFLIEEDWNPDIPAAVDIYADKTGYHCALNRYYQPDYGITQFYLTKIIAYFASDGWKPLRCEKCADDQKESRAALRTFNGRIYKMPVSHSYESKKVLDVNGDIAVYFKDASLICRSADKVYGKIGYALPFAVGSKAFITVGDTIFVVDGGAVINRYLLNFEELKNNGGGFRTTVLQKSVNFKSDCFSTDGDGGGDGSFLSYSTAENKFYEHKGEWSFEGWSREGE